MLYTKWSLDDMTLMTQIYINWGSYKLKMTLRDRFTYSVSPC